MDLTHTTEGCQYWEWEWRMCSYPESSWSTHAGRNCMKFGDQPIVGNIVKYRAKVYKKHPHICIGCLQVCQGKMEGCDGIVCCAVSPVCKLVLTQVRWDNCVRNKAELSYVVTDCICWLAFLKACQYMPSEHNQTLHLAHLPCWCWLFSPYVAWDVMWQW